MGQGLWGREPGDSWPSTTWQGREIPKFSHCPGERAQLREAWRAFDAQMVNGYDADLNLTRAQLKQRYRFAMETRSLPR
jgi:hypothetical protein